MRQIKYRGYNRKNGKWLYGFYLQNRGAHFVCPDEFAIGKTWDDYEVDPETVCEFTGLVDMNDKEVYEGDIVRLDGSAEYGWRIVVYYEEAFCLADRKEYASLKAGSHPYMNDYAHMDCLNTWSNTGLVCVAGNIIDNPEILED